MRVYGTHFGEMRLLDTFALVVVGRRQRSAALLMPAQCEADESYGDEGCACIRATRTDTGACYSVDDSCDAATNQCVSLSSASDTNGDGGDVGLIVGLVLAGLLLLALLAVRFAADSCAPLRPHSL